MFDLNQILSALSKFTSKKQAYFFIHDILKRDPTLTEKNVFDLVNLQSECEEVDDNTYNSYNEEIVKKLQGKINGKVMTENSITITMTTCKRYGLFIQTINSFINCCTDLLDYLYEWIIIDDNSSEEDRKKMQLLFPFVNFIFKTPDQKGHVPSMNTLINMVKTPYIFHLEDDWRFFVKDNFITKCLSVCKEDERFGQCLLNRGYGEDILRGAKIGGGYMRYSKDNVRYFIHEHFKGDILHKVNQELLQYGLGNCFYWCHFSLRVGLTKTDVFKKVGLFEKNSKHFEMEYSYRYYDKGYLSTYLDNVYCTHIGRRTYEMEQPDKINAYDLNNEHQFGNKPKTIAEEIPESSSLNTNPTVNTNIQLIKEENKEQNKQDPNQPKANVNLAVNVLNLKRRPDRIVRFNENNSMQLKRYNLFEAIDGQKLKPSQKIYRLFEPNDYKFRKGIVGCAMSHVKLWYDLLQNPTLQGSINIEDDAVLTDNFLEKIIHVINLAPDADIIFFHYHPYPQYDRQELQNKDKLPTVKRYSVEECFKESMGGTTAYYVTIRGAINLLNRLNSKGLVNAIDWEMYKTGDINKIYFTDPFIAFADCTQSGKNQDSDIQYDYSGVHFNSELEVINYELQFFKETGVKNNFEDTNWPIDPNSKVVCRKMPIENGFLRTISIFKRNDEIIKELNKYPVGWYIHGKYIFVVPEPMLTDEIAAERTLFENHLNEINIFDSKTDYINTEENINQIVEKLEKLQKLQKL